MWVEGQRVAGRLIEIWPSIVEIIDFGEKLPKSKLSSCKSYQSVLLAVKDELMPAKLKFFSFIANHLQLYLTRYQTDKPMLSFLNADLKDLSLKLLELIIKLKILKNYNTSLKLTKIIR